MGRQVLSPTASNESPMTFAVLRQVGSRPARASGSGFKLDRKLDLVFHDPELCFSGLLDAAPLRERFPGLTCDSFPLLIDGVSLEIVLHTGDTAHEVLR